MAHDAVRIHTGGRPRLTVGMLLRHAQQPWLHGGECLHDWKRRRQASVGAGCCIILRHAKGRRKPAQSAFQSPCPPSSLLTLLDNRNARASGKREVAIVLATRDGRFCSCPSVPRDHPADAHRIAHGGCYSQVVYIKVGRVVTTLPYLYQLLPRSILDLIRTGDESRERGKHRGQARTQASDEKPRDREKG